LAEYHTCGEAETGRIPAAERVTVVPEVASESCTSGTEVHDFAGLLGSHNALPEQLP